MQATTMQKICDRPALLQTTASWFAQKWGIPLQAYQESMQACIQNKTGVPQWYVVLNEAQQIIAGAGVIENDFHDRSDLTPNLCALFVEEPFRRQGLAKGLLDFARQDMAAMGVKRLYLVTDHTDFYERCGWEFFTLVHDSEGVPERMYTAPTP